MLTEQIFKDVTEIHSRLLDHHPVLQGHLRAFVREFEEKRGNREMDQLDKLHGVVSGMKNKTVEETRSAFDTFLTNLQAKLQVAIEVCSKIEEKENNIEVGHLELERGRRRREWDIFMQEQFERSAEVDKQMDGEMRAVAERYQELEAELERKPLSTVTP